MSSDPVSPTPVRRRRYAKRMAASERREQLLDAALELINEEGIEALTMRVIASHAGVTKPVVYDFFANIDELTDALIERAQRVVVRSVATAWPFVDLGDDPDPETMFSDVAISFMRAAMQTDPDELITQALQNWLGAVAEHPASWRLILRPPEGIPASVRERMEEIHQSGVAALAVGIPFLRQRRAGDKEIAHLDPAHTEVIANLVHAGLLRLAQLVTDDPERFRPDDLAAFIARIATAIEKAIDTDITH